MEYLRPLERIKRRFQVLPWEVQLAPGITGVINQVNDVLENVGGPRMPGFRKGICSIAADLVKRASEVRGMQAITVQNRKVHECFSGGRVDSFRHSFNIVTDVNNRYLVDETFFQFVDAKTLQVGAGEVVSGKIQDHPIVLELLTSGYVPLSDESIRAYLRATASKERRYLDSIGVREVLDPSFAIPYTEDIRELDKYLSGKAVPQDAY